MGRILNTAKKRRLISSPKTLTPRQRHAIRANVLRSAFQSIDDLYDLLNTEYASIRRPVERYMAKICTYRQEPEERPHESPDGKDPDEEAFWDGTVQL